MSSNHDQTTENALSVPPPASPLPRAPLPHDSPAAVVAAFYDALVAADAQRAIALLSPEVAWFEAPGSPYGREDGSPYRGGDEVARHVLGPQAADVEGLELARHETLIFGDTIIVLGTAQGRGARTGTRLTAPFAHVWALDGTKIREFRQYIDVTAFRSAVGRPALQ
jgi:ketosteroid isomerase-like protein